MTDKDTWENRQKHASFFQNQLGIQQQGAIASSSSAAIVITIGLFMARPPGASIMETFAGVLIAVIAWGILSYVLTAGFSRSAVRIEREYHDEHGTFFPGTHRYRLESYLLDFARHHPWLFKDKKDDGAADATSTGRAATALTPSQTPTALLEEAPPQINVTSTHSAEQERLPTDRS